MGSYCAGGDAEEEGGKAMMRYPNLVWAIEKKRFAHYEVAAIVKIERTRFSRCLHGVSEFAPHEMTRIGEALGYTAAWLFSEPKPPNSLTFDGENTAAVTLGGNDGKSN
jgi:hypothetical protein